jgi:hypothetical protein
MVAGIIATIAVLGLAHTFSLGRSFINRFEVARAALGIAQQRLELLHGVDPSSEAFAESLHVRPFTRGGEEVGTEEWRVSWFDDPATPGTSNDLKQVTVVVRWTVGATTDSLKLQRFFLP